MKKIIILLAFLCCLPAFSQRSRDTIFSEKLNMDREFTVSLPLSYGKNKDRKYPLLLLLDGEYLLDAYDGALAYGNYWDDLPEVVIVAVNQNSNGEREADSVMDEEGLPTETGAAFFEFIGTELIPALDKKYRLSPFRIIGGHDVTAGFLNLFLYKENPLFNAYICFSPEFGLQMMERIPVMLQTTKKPIFYYMASGDGDLKKNLADMRTLDTNIKTVLHSNVYYAYDEFKGASHYSLVLYGIPASLYHIFGQYQPISTAEFQEKIVKMEKGYVDYLIKKYDIIEKSYGMKMPVRISDFKAIEAAIIKNNAFDELEKLAAIAKKSYPKAMLSQYEMGMFYEKTGDTKKAAKAYQNAYLMDEIGDLTKDMMLDKADELKKGGSK
ncbi:alpha/beta hydrolase [Flavobacterium pallidum]|uniref:Histidine kinase n=1 Tax=Flavobacterium pallidum TaxID=2172098 RepID=A0A2S1SFY3_9FLAO|nr:alpha/beta hydrolase-fold protein [Flavobacterium pallidum]AWI25323.1 histidine kinase [Flavobacterium pallidum]